MIQRLDWLDCEIELIRITFADSEEDQREEYHGYHCFIGIVLSIRNLYENSKGVLDQR